jgi:hypothetical protein
MGVLYPTTWDEIHINALKANTPYTRGNFYTWIRDISSKFQGTCSCQDHMKKYLRKHPPEASESPFKWSWEFHNSVNKRLRKRQVPYQEALNNYLPKVQ